MKILFLHISDLHFDQKKLLYEFQTKKILDTLNSVGPFDRLVIIISGDITKSGEQSQFKNAFKIVGSIIRNAKVQCKYYGHIDVLCVPGNHDINHEGNCLSSEKLQGIRKLNTYDKHIVAELKKMKAFFNFAKGNECFTDDMLFSRRIIKMNGFSIEANMINTAVFSSLDEDKGLHYIPQNSINELNTPSGSDFVITIMHHSYDWYIDSQKNLLEAAILGKSSIVFLGHEHFIASKSISHERRAGAIVQAGGCLIDNNNWSKSEYNIGLLDTDSMNYDLFKFRWNLTENQYEILNKIQYSIAAKPSTEKRLIVQFEYLKILCQDAKQDLADDFRKYFVFPRIQAEDHNGSVGKEFIEKKSFVEDILLHKKVLVTGGYNSGKTTLLKSLFLSLTDEYIVIFCNISDIRGKKADRIIKNSFEDIYGENQSDYDRFTQAPKEKRILIIDDIDQISSSDFESFVSQLNDTFEFFIFASKQVLDIDLIEKMKVYLKTTDRITKYRIVPFFTDKRNELIQKIVELFYDDSESVIKNTKLLSDAIKSQKRFISFEPDFIIKYVKYFCKNIGEAANNNSGIFSKVFEANLVNSISKYQTGKLSVDKVFVLLSKIAHFIHFNRVYPIPRTELLRIIENYNVEYGSNVDIVAAVNIMTNSKILTNSEDESGFRFANNSYLAFFVAKEVNSHYNLTGDDLYLQKLLKCSCFGINSDILLFISYITDNIRILRYFIHMINEFTNKWSEFDFGDTMPEYLKEERSHYIEPPSTDAKSKEDEREIEAERNGISELKTLDIYDYSEDEVEKFINQIIRACSLLTVVSKCLPNFEHNMPKNDKDAFVKIIYQLPNKIFQIWASEIDKQTDEIIQYFNDQSQDYYLRQRAISSDDIIAALQWGSMSFLLELYNLSIFHSTKDNTFSYLDDFNYSAKTTFELEHLMMLEKMNYCQRFTDTAIKLEDEKNCHIYKILLKRIINHALIFMENIDYRTKQRLQSKFYPSVSSNKQRQIIYQRSKNANIE